MPECGRSRAWIDYGRPGERPVSGKLLIGSSTGFATTPNTSPYDRAEFHCIREKDNQMNTVVENALVKAAERILGRSLPPAERSRLIDAYRRSSGTTRQKAERALADLFGWTDDDYSKRASASDNTGRAIRDLESVIDELQQWAFYLRVLNLPKLIDSLHLTRATVSRRTLSPLRELAQKVGANRATECYGKLDTAIDAIIAEGHSD